MGGNNDDGDDDPDMVRARPLACSGDFLLRLAVCHGKDLIAEGRRSAQGVAESLARELTAAAAVPTIGIGGSPVCDGQILVIDDMLGLLTEFTPQLSTPIRGRRR
jgi:hypothetical protein